MNKEEENKPPIRARRFIDELKFQSGIIEMLEEGYILHSWACSNDGGVYAVFLRNEQTAKALLKQPKV